MKFTSIRLTGFKSFVEPTDFEIREGLTGIVGPNGCGKSNLLEALSWVMGATSARSLRGDGMDSVIFSGSSMRPARNRAEVVLTLDNSGRTAPPEYNGHDTLEVSRQIVRGETGSHSVYRINSAEVRARDVQLLFSDASTGASSPALVRQGQVAALIGAKPSNRRRLLEEAAGVTGLHSRRHEARLRLRATEQNLERLDDVTGELEGRRKELSRQARQATRYRNISGDIRRTEAMLYHLRWQEAVAARDAIAAELADVTDRARMTAIEAARAGKEQAAAHENLDPLRKEETRASAAVHRLSMAREELDREARRAGDALASSRSRTEQLQKDLAREEGLLEESRNALKSLEQERDTLVSVQPALKDRVVRTKADLDGAQETLELAQARFDRCNGEAAGINAARKSAETVLADADRRLEHNAGKQRLLEKEREGILPGPEQEHALDEAGVHVGNTGKALSAAEEDWHRATQERARFEDREAELRAPLAGTGRRLAGIDAERVALRRILETGSSGEWSPLVEMVDVTPGYENALAAALGDDLDAAIDPEAPGYWSSLGEDGIAMADLPAGTQPLSRFVQAPAVLARRLAAIGVVEPGTPPDDLCRQLAPGQRLVTPDGALWRWDGYTVRADAGTASAVRLEQRNRLVYLDGQHETVARELEKEQAVYAGVADRLRSWREEEKRTRAAFNAARKAAEDAARVLSGLERDHERATARIASIDDSLARLEEDACEMRRRRDLARKEQAALPDAAIVERDLAVAREAVSAARAGAGQAGTARTAAVHALESSVRRLEKAAQDCDTWTSRMETAGMRIHEISGRLEKARQEYETAKAAPFLIEEKRKALLDRAGEAESTRNRAADALAAAVEAAGQADSAAKAATVAAAQTREEQARLEVQEEAAAVRVEEAEQASAENCSCAPDGLLSLSGHAGDSPLPSRSGTERKLDRLKRERENMGAVNLRAEEEMAETVERMGELVAEREDCETAMQKLRSAIGSLNREARQRLREAFEIVNRNFTSLFTQLFDGGHAELRLVDSDDPLEAGLEILASPPGKKLTSLSLMSGGEQALTATSLIFAVFMANPAPVCVLDEVDAPLDDANVDRFCRLLAQMARDSQTRFLVITHHALSMSRMDRLYGVTMVERGVSQLVSVDLSRAEQLVAA